VLGINAYRTFAEVVEYEPLGDRFHQTLINETVGSPVYLLPVDLRCGVETVPATVYSARP